MEENKRYQCIFLFIYFLKKLTFHAVVDFLNLGRSCSISCLNKFEIVCVRNILCQRNATSCSASPSPNFGVTIEFFSLLRNYSPEIFEKHFR